MPAPAAPAQSHAAAGNPAADAAAPQVRGNPVEGSVFLRLEAKQPRPLAALVELYQVKDTSVAAARHAAEVFLANREGIPDGFSDVAVLLVSELTTNAYKAMAFAKLRGLACIELSMRLFKDRLLVEVIDSSPFPPRPKLTEDTEAEHWRGLAVVSDLSQDWGWYRSSARKAVFFVLSSRPPARKANDGPCHRRGASCLGWGP